MCQRQPLFIWYGTKTYFLQAFSWNKKDTL
jgi:hypothetical protein